MAQETGERKIATAEQARKFLLVLCLILLVFTLASAVFDLRGIDEQYDQLATEVGRSFYQAINVMRQWNFDQGGIYVRLTEGTLPNPYLIDPLREVVTIEGLKLTMINHAQMTRLLSELLTRQNGIHLHIMSLTPVRPENKPDAWEQQALIHFEQGSNEEHVIEPEAGANVFRYIAPLRTNDSCLPCHSRPEETTHKVRGGISVAFSYTPFERAITGERRRILILHGMFLGLGLGLIVLVGTRLVHSIGALQASLLTIKRLEGLLPICSKCKKIRTPGGDHRKQHSWVAIESYIAERTDAEFTHSLCPECSRELYPDIFPDRETGSQ
jgi:hypothetical protein